MDSLPGKPSGWIEIEKILFYLKGRGIWGQAFPGLNKKHIERRLPNWHMYGIGFSFCHNNCCKSQRFFRNPVPLFFRPRFPARIGTQRHVITGLHAKEASRDYTD